MKYLLDTNACIVYLNKPQSGIAAKLRQQRLQDVFVCSVVKAELYFGAMQSQWPEKNPAHAATVSGAFLIPAFR